jgi:hypothetical protein
VDHHLRPALWQLHPEIVARTTDSIAEPTGKADHDSDTDLLCLNNELSISLVIARYRVSSTDLQSWHIHLNTQRHQPERILAINQDTDIQLSTIAKKNWQLAAATPNGP